MNIENTLNELAMEIGAKDGKAGFRSFVGGNMLDKTPPEHMNLGNKIMAYLNKTGTLKNFTKFNPDVLDVQTQADGSIILNPEDGVAITLSKEKVAEIMKE